jgi:hypothetical protein
VPAIRKQGGTTLLEQYNLTDIQNLAIEATHTVKFEYDIPDHGGCHVVRCRADNASILYDTIIDRLRAPKRDRDRGSGSRASTDAETLSSNVPRYLQVFRALEDLPRPELLAAAEPLDLAGDAVRQFAANPRRLCRLCCRSCSSSGRARRGSRYKAPTGRAGGPLLRSAAHDEDGDRGRRRSPCAPSSSTSSALTLLAPHWVHERVDAIRGATADLLSCSGAIAAYAGSSGGEARHPCDDREKQPILRSVGCAEKLLKDCVAVVEKYFTQHEPFELIS